MSDFDYKKHFDMALWKISDSREKPSGEPFFSDDQLKTLEDNMLLNFKIDDEEKYLRIISIAKQTSVSAIRGIIINLFDHYKIPVQILNTPQDDYLKNAYLLLIDSSSKSLYVFKVVESSPLVKSADKEPPVIQKILKTYSLENAFYVYLLKDQVSLQIITNKTDGSDIENTYHFHNLQWVFDRYFPATEYSQFSKWLKYYNDLVQENLDFFVIRSLNQKTLIRFRGLMEAEILRFKYSEKIQSNTFSVFNKTLSLSDAEFQKIKTQYIDNKYYLAALGTSDFSISLLTAEWLYDSMKRSKAIDLTVVGMGYLKSVEQLLYSLICLHSKQKRFISGKYVAKIELTDQNIENDLIDSTIGSMAFFLKDNLNILRKELAPETKEYIKEAVFKFKDIRNGYFHKDNIDDWNVIDTIRDTSYEMFFLLLGGKFLTGKMLKSLGFNNPQQNDFEKICEYISFHSGELFLLDDINDNRGPMIARSDPYSKIENNKVQYSGLYFQHIGEPRVSVFKECNILPKRIITAVLQVEVSENNQLNIPKIVPGTIVFENGRFLASPVIFEELFDY